MHSCYILQVKNEQHSEIRSLFPLYTCIIENESLKHDFSLCLPRILTPVHPIKQSFCYKALLKEFIR